jgi:hypothetical protein
MKVALLSVVVAALLAGIVYFANDVSASPEGGAMWNWFVKWWTMVNQ